MGIKSLLVGINAYEAAPLRGCVNDVTSMRDLLQQQYKLNDDSIRILLDTQATRAAIIDGLHWLAEADGTNTPPIRHFHFSGHGVSVADKHGDEPDGQDEALAPYDYQTAGFIVDDVLHDLYKAFPAEAHLVLTMDCCHSGTIQFDVTMDSVPRFLPISDEEYKQIQKAKDQFLIQRNELRKQLERDLSAQGVAIAELPHHIARALQAHDKKKHFGYDQTNAITVLIAACRSFETAADARFDQTYNGALTYYLTQTLREGGSIKSYAELMDIVTQKISNNKFSQVPQLECREDKRTLPFLNILP